MKPLRLPAWLYQQFGADYDLDVPQEGYAGWRQVAVSLPLKRTALAAAK